MVLSGEGADESFGGYLNFKNKPIDVNFQKGTIRRVKRLSTADCVRADKFIWLMFRSASAVS